MTRVAKVLPRLVGTFVCAHLQINDTFASAELLFGELALVFLRRFWPDEWTLELRMEIALQSTQSARNGCTFS